jgi:hypothetical protein
VAKLSDLDDSKIDIVELIFQWLESNNSGEWLIILDNADSADVFSQSGGDRRQMGDPTENIITLSDYLPQNS